MRHRTRSDEAENQKEMDEVRRRQARVLAKLRVIQASVADAVEEIEQKTEEATDDGSRSDVDTA